MRGTGRKRPWLAALLAVIYPGLGHVYLREWARAILWFGVVLLTAALLVPAGAVPEDPSIGALTQVSRDVPLEATVGITVVSVLSVVDAYWVATRNNREQESATEGESEGPTTECPNCGRDLDADIDFCHWCTTELDGDAPEEEST